MLRSYIKVYIGGKQQNSYEVVHLNSTNFRVKILPDHDYTLKDIAIRIEGEEGVGMPVPEFAFEVDGLNVFVVKLDDKEKGSLQDMYGFSEVIMTWTEKIYAVLKTTVASYFLINIINFWNLSLMYNVLNISTIPAFSKNFLEKLTFLFFNLNSLIEWAQANIPSLKDKLDFTQIDGR